MPFSFAQKIEREVKPLYISQYGLAIYTSPNGFRTTRLYRAAEIQPAGKRQAEIQLRPEQVHARAAFKAVYARYEEPRRS